MTPLPAVIRGIPGIQFQAWLDWPAARLVETYYRPAVVGQVFEEEG